MKFSNEHTSAGLDIISPSFEHGCNAISFSEDYLDQRRHQINQMYHFVLDQMNQPPPKSMESENENQPDYEEFGEEYNYLHEFGHLRLNHNSLFSGNHHCDDYDQEQELGYEQRNSSSGCIQEIHRFNYPSSPSSSNFSVNKSTSTMPRSLHRFKRVNFDRDTSISDSLSPSLLPPFSSVRRHSIASGEMQDNNSNLHIKQTLTPPPKRQTRTSIFSNIWSPK